MNSIDLLNLRNNTMCVLLDESTIATILGYFNQSNIKTIKVAKKQVNILKNNKIQNKKDLNENKLIMIMNKLSHNNINELVKEYLQTITINTLEEYNTIQYEIFCKLFKDITFIDNYIPFIVKIFSIEKYRLSFEPIHFIEIIEYILLSCYKQTMSTLTLVSKYSPLIFDEVDLSHSVQDIIDSNNESDRASFLQIIKKLIKFDFFTKDLYHNISNLLLTTTYKIDIYYWFSNNPELRDKYKDNIINTIKYCCNNNMKREELMLESLFDCKTIQPSLELPVVKSDPLDNLIVSIDNIIEEYLYLEIIEEVGKFIMSDCNALEDKNIFCSQLLKFYFSTSDKRLVILNLYDNLIKKKYLYKSNLSKGLLLYLDKHTINKTDNIESFLKFLKNNNITKNVEHVFKKYHVKINYETL